MLNGLAYDAWNYKLHLVRNAHIKKGSRAQAEELLNQKSRKEAEQVLWDLVKEEKSETKEEKQAKTACLKSLRSAKNSLN